MAIPDKIKIGPVGYTVKEIEDLHRVDDEGVKRWLHGHIWFTDSEIRIASDQSQDIKIVSLWHEILHGILNGAGQAEQPEPLIEAISFGLVQLIRDNPVLIEATICKQESVSAGNE